MITVDNAFDVEPNAHKSVIVQISEFVYDLIEHLELDDYRASQVDGKEVLITTLSRDEDVLVYLCSIAERIMFQKKINERIDDSCEPKLKNIQLQRLKMVSAFVQLFS